MSEILRRAIEHFDSQKGKTISVPEWGDGPGRPLVIHYDPLTMRERRKVFTKAAANDLGAMVDVLILKAKDATGNPLFGEEHRHQLMTAVDPVVIVRIGQEMLQASEFTPDTAQKN